MKSYTYKLAKGIFLFLLIINTGMLHAKDSAIVVFDASGSMWGQIKGKTKIEIARDVMGTLVKDWNEDVELGLIAYGHREKGNCNDIEVLQPVSSIDSDKILQTINKISPKGKTPISKSLKKAAETLRYTEDNATVILISDGEETCKADPCAVSKDLEKQGINFTAHVIGFDIKGNKKAKEQLKCIADNTGGKFFEAEDAASLKKSLIKVKQAVVDPRPTVCKQYAEEAVKHEQTNLEEECGFEGKHWSTEYATHYDWCVSEEIGSVLPNVEKQKRIEALKKCQESKTKTVVIKTKIGSLKIINTRDSVRIYDQETGKEKGYWGSHFKQGRKVQLPAGMYKLGFKNFTVNDIEITANETKVVDASKLVGWISITNTQDSVRIYDQQSNKEKGYWGSHFKQGRKVQLPAGTYKLKSKHFELNDIVIEAGQKLVVKIENE